ncbi:5'-methylthioadenosine/S-adenosylhomocysteine nucleosidase [Sphingomicrobium clamense]|uniref:5'-methylthioadenosine/S-adenosylhomocysteine nucleosidase n=1 Tax=Sphingomicrobium clamense TaxID=2851013 RepID=A0ABS6V3A6_9SPHN|nr:5'-methylthioadenosine/S-adenosylhomocysteine nucleosidase [Sphingomicrobium sp. B8]
MTEPKLGGGKPQRVGLISGLLEEAQAFRPGQGEVDSNRPFYCRHDGDFTVACSGIGKVNASIAAACLIDHGCDLLVSLGVAGRLCEGALGPHWIVEAVQHDYGARRPNEFARYCAGSLPFGDSELEAYTSIDDPGLGLPKARILTGDCFLEDEAQAVELGQTLDGELIDMETGAIAQVAYMFGVPWAGIRSVSDAADVGSVADFQRNLDRAAREAAIAADRLLKLL